MWEPLTNLRVDDGVQPAPQLVVQTRPLVLSVLVLVVTILVVLAAVVTFILLTLTRGGGVMANRIGRGPREALLISPPIRRPPTRAKVAVRAARPLLPAAALTAHRGTA